MSSHSRFTFASDRTPHIYSKWVFQQVPSQGFLDLTFPSSFASPADGTSKQGVNVKPIFEAGLTFCIRQEPMAEMSIIDGLVNQKVEQMHSISGLLGTFSWGNQR